MLNENKLIDLCLIYGINEPVLYIELLDKQIKFYQNKINYLRNIKPFFFRKRKLKEYNKLIESYEHKIYDIYNRINIEFEVISKVKNVISNKKVNN